MPERTDRELLELAAKSAGIDWVGHMASGALATDKNGSCLIGPWNPLTDDGDALRLAVKLELLLRLRHSENAVRVYGGPYGAIDESVRGDPDAATRRAIVRASAEIGANMQS